MKLRISYPGEEDIFLSLFITSKVRITPSLVTIEDISSNLELAIINTEILCQGLKELEVAYTLPTHTKIRIPSKDGVFEELTAGFNLQEGGFCFPCSAVIAGRGFSFHLKHLIYADPT